MLVHQLLTYGSVALLLFLLSPKPILKFAATRTLVSLALQHPTSVATCNVDLENLITDTNHGVATFAITSLLKVSFSQITPACTDCQQTGNEASVDRLVK